MNTRTTEEFRDDLAQFDTCMLATKDGSRLRSRPMKPYFDNPDGTIRFLTSSKTHKVNEVEANPDANAVFADEDGTWISVSGKIRLSESAADIDELWSPDAAALFFYCKALAVVIFIIQYMEE